MRLRNAAGGSRPPDVQEQTTAEGAQSAGVSAGTRAHQSRSVMMLGRPPARRGLVRRLAGAAIRLALIVVAGVLICAALVRYSPGFESEEADIDARLSHETSVAVHQRAGTAQSFPAFALDYFRRAIHGDLGVSRTFNSPVADLLRDRVSATSVLMISGITL